MHNFPQDGIEERLKKATEKNRKENVSFRREQGIKPTTEVLKSVLQS